MRGAGPLTERLSTTLIKRKELTIPWTLAREWCRVLSIILQLKTRPGDAQPRRLSKQKQYRLLKIEERGGGAAINSNPHQKAKDKSTLRTFVILLMVALLVFPNTHAGIVSAQSQNSFVCPMHPGVVSSAQGDCPRCGMQLVSRAAKPGLMSQARRKRSAGAARQSGGAKSKVRPSPPQPAPPRPFAGLSTAERVRELERLAPTYEYSCIMHPEVRQAQDGSCPKCGMMLRTIKPSVLGEYKLALATKPLRPKPGEKALLRFVISNPETGATVRDFVVNHEKLFHLFIVSQDMTEYQHIHPQLERDGSFVVETVLPRAGLYKLHADFFPAGGTIQILHRELATAGYRASKVPLPALLTPDRTLVKTVDGMKISLELGGTSIPVAGALVPLKYRVTDERTGELVRDLEPYLGAWGHTLILNANQSEYLHSHPTEMLPDKADMASLRGGPEVEFRAMFPAAGNYRIWTQFQRAGRVTTVFFTISIAG